MKMLKFQSTLSVKVRGQSMEYRSTALEIPFVDAIKIYEKKIVCKGCQKMIYPECFVVCKEKLKGKCTCKCKCKKIK